MKLIASRLLILLTLLSSQMALADILFLDMNNSPKEVEAAQRAARQRGERLVVIPTQTEESRNRYLKLEAEVKRLSQEAESNQCFRGSTTGVCGQISTQRRAAFDVLRKASPKADSNTIKAALLELKKEGRAPSSVIISGHDGSGKFSGVFGSTSAKDLGELFNELGMNEAVRSVHLWGCYTTTLGSIELYWKKNFPHLALLTGYNGVAPANDKPAGWSYLEGVLAKEKELIEAGDLKKLQKLFNSIPNIGMVHAAICADELYVSHGEATTIDAAFNSCEQNITQLEEDYETYLCYQQASKPECADVPETTGAGPLREYYNKLHDSRHCSELSQFKERLDKLPTPDQVIRLIHTRHVRGNFVEAFGKEIVETDQILRELGAPESLTFNDLNRMPRGELISRLEELKKFIDERSMGQTPDPFKVTEEDAKLEAMRGFWQSANKALIESDPECVPFSWVEPNSHEPSCISPSVMGRSQAQMVMRNPNDVIARRLKKQVESLDEEIRKLQERSWQTQKLTPIEKAKLDELKARRDLAIAQHETAFNQSILVKAEILSARTPKDQLKGGIQRRIAAAKEQEAIARLRIERAQTEQKFLQDGRTSREEFLKLEELRLKADIREASVKIQESKKTKISITDLVPGAPGQSSAAGGGDRDLTPFRESQKALVEKQLELNLLEQRHTQSSGQGNLTPEITTRKKEVESLARKSAEDFYNHLVSSQETSVRLAKNRLQYMLEDESDEFEQGDVELARMKLEDAEMALDEYRNSKEDFIKGATLDLMNGTFKEEDYLMMRTDSFQSEPANAPPTGAPMQINPQDILDIEDP